MGASFKHDNLWDCVGVQTFVTIGEQGPLDTIDKS